MYRNTFNTISPFFQSFFPITRNPIYLKLFPLWLQTLLNVNSMPVHAWSLLSNWPASGRRWNLYYNNWFPIYIPYLFIFFLRSLRSLYLFLKKKKKKQPLPFTNSLNFSTSSENASLIVSLRKSRERDPAVISVTNVNGLSFNSPGEFHLIWTMNFQLSFSFSLTCTLKLTE